MLTVMWVCAFCIAHGTIVRACKCLRVCACVCSGATLPSGSLQLHLCYTISSNLPNNEAGVETGEKGDSEDHALKH